MRSPATRFTRLPLAQSTLQSGQLGTTGMGAPQSDMEAVLLSSDESRHLCRDIECPAIKVQPPNSFRVKLLDADQSSYSSGT